MASTTSNNIEEWDLSDAEVAHIICSGPYTSSGGSQKLYVAKIMPQISNNLLLF